MESYEIQYLNLLSRILNNGTLEENIRTKTKTKRLFGEKIVVDLSKEYPLIQGRKMFPVIAAAELAWTLSGDENISWLQKYTKIWDNFSENGIVKNSYGNRWAKKFGRNQLLECCALLNKDRSSRQTVVMAWDPAQDGLSNAGKEKNVPCPLGFSACIIDGLMNICVFQRSADCFLGLPYDILMYSLLNVALANTCLAMPGKTVFMIADAHLYDNQFQYTSTMLMSGIRPGYGGGIMPKSDFSIDEIINNKDAYVADIKSNLSRFKFQDFTPKVEVIK